MKLQVFTVCLIYLFATCSAQNWSLSGSASTGNKGSKVDLKLSHDFGKWSLTGGGSIGTNGWGASIGAKIKFKRAARIPVFNIWVEADPCKFETYDFDRNGLISFEEMSALFKHDRPLGRLLFLALDTVKVDGGITKEEFEQNSRMFISRCRANDKARQSY